MDFQPKRRSGIVTYGRNSRKTVVHDFFADEKSKEPPRPQLPLSPNSPGTRSAAEPIADHDPPSPAPARPAHVTTHSSSPTVFLDIPAKSTSPSNSSRASTVNGRSLYDMTSSDDEAGPAVKRRKFQPSQKSETSRLSMMKRPERPLSGPASKMREQRRDLSAESYSRPKSASPPHVRTHSVPLKHDRLTKPDVISSGTSNMSTGVGQNPSKQGIEKAPASPTRKKWQQLASSNTQVESPSRLGLSRLRLTSNRHSSSSAESTDDQSMDEVSHRSRGRQRLIDKLDAPDISDTEGQQEQEKTDRNRSTSAAATAKLAPPQSDINHPPRRPPVNNSSKQTYGRSRTTYAKERSYLTDMADDTDSIGSAQDPSQQLTSELNAAIAQSQLHPDLDMDESSDDNQVTGSKLKSIHELRQAGTNQKLGRELESLFEDIDPASSNATKSLRLQALMKLARRLTDPAFTVTLLNGGLRRLSQWLEKCPDPATNVLIALITWKLCHTTQVSQSSLRLMHVIAVHVSRILLDSTQSLPELIKDRKQNLSKAVSRDLLKFEIDAIEDDLLPAHEGRHIIPAVVALGLLNDTIRTVVEYKMDSPKLSPDMHQQIYGIVMHSSLADEDETGSGDRFMVRLALTFWQSCCGPLDDDLQLSKAQYHDLGNAMSRFLVSEDSSLLFAALHMMTTLANNRSAVCGILAATSLPAHAISFVCKTFARLTNDAKSGTEIDTTLLNELVLALAFLIKLSEYDDANRLNISLQKPDGNGSAIELLTNTYLTVGPQVKDATTAEQSQVLVALGYLSILICALSLEPTVRKRIRQALGATSFQDVRSTGEEFLKMFLVHATQTATNEGLGDDVDATVQIDDSTKGFAHILAACRI